MQFDPNQTDFPSPRHRAIWDEGRRIVPLEVSLADIEDTEMLEGCTQIFSWTQECFAALYADPYRFAGKTPRDIFRLLGKTGENPDIVDHQEYPLFSKYFKLLYGAADKRKVNRLDYLACCDFRVLAPKYQRSFDDLLRTLPDSLKAYALEMNEHARTKQAKLEPHKYYCHFRYKYKKEDLMLLRRNSWRRTPLDIAIPYGDLERFLAIAEAQPDKDALVSYIQRELCACDACNGKKKAADRCSKQWVDIDGVWRLPALCHRDISKWKASKRNLEYSDYDIQMLKRMMDIRVIQIDKLK